MKNINKWIFASFCVITLASCSESFLVRDPYGDTITQGQYEKMANQLEGSLRGIYSMMYNVTDHDEFGKRSIDMYTDIMCGDLALTNHIYGWFYSDELLQGQTGRTGYIWYYYYRMLHNVNAVLYAAQGGGTASADNVIKRIAANGLPNTVKTVNSEYVYYNIVGTDTLATYTEEEANIAYYYAQALALRGYIYSNLVMLYTPTSRYVSNFNTELTFPLYTENNMDYAQPLATLTEVYAQLESDLTNAIDYFDAFNKIDRSSKLMIDGTLARAFLAYSYLNKGATNGHGDTFNNAYTNALKYAQEAITNAQTKESCSILSRRDLLTTGFNDVNNTSWMWGQNVTVETAGGLASFFGQVDIHSYSYAWAGDTKAIDENLYKEIPDFDARKLWFNDGKANSTYKYCPDGKFFSASNPKSTKADDIDREWLSDNVYMRIESMYLIASEASFRLGKDDDAISYLTAITDERIAEGMDAEYATWKSGLTHANLLAAIEYNWRVELWGEGYGLQTFRRLTPETLSTKERRRGANHDGTPGAKIESKDYIFPMPSSETSYNPAVKNTTKLP